MMIKYLKLMNKLIMLRISTQKVKNGYWEKRELSI